MDKELILHEIKNEMGTLVSSIDFGNNEENSIKINQYFEFIKVLSELPTFEMPGMQIPNNTQKIEQFKEAVVISGESNDFAESEETYVFERKVRGGIVRGLDSEEGYMVPEKMVRDIGLMHEDIVRVVSKNVVPDKYNRGMKRSHYRLEVVESSEKELEGRKEYRFCVVQENYEQGFYVTGGNGENIVVNGVETEIYLREKDVVKFNITAGDIIDIAFIEENAHNSVMIIAKEEVEHSFFR